MNYNYNNNIFNKKNIMDDIRLTPSLELFLDLNQHFSPKLSSKKLKDGSMITSPLEDMWPFLENEELTQNIIK